MPGSEQMSLEDLVELFLEDADFAAGVRPSPRPVEPPEVLRVLDDIFAGCDQCDHIMPGVAEELGCNIACERGCPGKCCEVLVLVTVPEGMAIVAALANLDDAAKRDRYVERLHAWKQQFGERADDAACALAEGRQDAYETIVRQHALEHTMCPLAEGQVCGVYESRPLICRKVWVADTWQNCGGSTEPGRPDAKLIAHPAVDDFYAGAKQVSRSMQAALGLATSLQPLPLVVLALLEALAVSDEPQAEPSAADSSVEPAADLVDDQASDS